MAVIWCVPPVSVEMAHVAVLLLVPGARTPAPVLVQVRVVDPSLKVTVPVG